VKRVSNISSPADFALETEREALRDRRWRRRRDIVLAIAWFAGACGLGLRLPHLIPALLRFF
jgi:hypothetical protein